MARHKYGARKIKIDGVLFDSKAESIRYLELKLMQQQGLIKGLVLQPVYVLAEARRVAGKHERAITYKADFSYTGADGVLYIEDVKGVETEVFKIKRKLLLFRYADKFDSKTWVFQTVKYRTR